MLSIISKILKAESSLKSATPVPLLQPIPRRLIAAVRTATATLHTIATPHRRPTPYIIRAAAIVAHGAASVTHGAASLPVALPRCPWRCHYKSILSQVNSTLPSFFTPGTYVALSEKFLYVIAAIGNGKGTGIYEYSCLCVSPSV